MPTDPAADALRMAEVFGIVAAAAVPVGLAGWLIAKRNEASPPPHRSILAVKWTGWDALILLGISQLLPLFLMVGLTKVGFYRIVYGPAFPELVLAFPSVEVGGAVGGAAAAETAVSRNAAVNQQRMLWGMLFAFPAFVAAAVAMFAAGGGRLSHPGRRNIAGQVAVGVLAWAALMPLVFAVHFVAGWAAEALGAPPDEHPLARIDPNAGALEAVLFAAVVCGLMPFVEELIFRGVLLGWAIRRIERSWFVLAGGVVGSILGWKAFLPIGPAAFIVLLFAGLYAVPIVFKRSHRTATAIYATGAAFGLVHSAVWPTPIPLFVLGLGLGYLAVRTRGIVACAVAHGLFNAVSFVYLLRGGAGGM